MRFLITTPIYYVNDKPHIGHAYTTLAADVLTRFLRNQGKEVFFLTGTDEHGSKIAQSAKKLGISPKVFCDKNSRLFKNAWENLNIKYDFFIRTTDAKHEENVKSFLNKLKEKNILYKKNYEGLYCIECEKFLTEKELFNGKCRDHNIRPTKVLEKNYFFPLKDFLKKIEDLIKTEELKIEPESAKKEALGLIRQGLDDFSISRRKVRWGIKLPFDKSQTVYVWVDALLNYITGDGSKKFKQYWWENGYVIHILGKDILKFHTIYWPALLIAAGIKVPNQEFIHGFFTVNGQKMSKTLRNTIDPNNLVEKFGADATRYLLLSQFPFGQDGDIKEENFVKKYNSDLANGLGNLIARILTLLLLAKYDLQNPKYRADKKILEMVKGIDEGYKKYMGNLKFYEALKEIWKLIDYCNKYINENKPWELIKTNKKKSDQILSNLLYCIFKIVELISPFLPVTSEKIRNQLKSGKLEILFPRMGASY